MIRFLLTLFVLLSTINSHRRFPCTYLDIISWSAEKTSETRGVNLTKCDGFGAHRFIIDRPVNSSKSIRTRISSLEESTDDPLSIRVNEIAAGQDGKEIYFERKALSGVDDSVISSPFTRFNIMVVKRGPMGKAEVVFQFTLEDDGCPYPFLESRIGSPLVISSEILAYECDFSVSAVEPGAALELTSINESMPHQKHSVAVVIYDGFSHARLHRVEQSEFDADLKEHLGTPKVTVHVTNPSGGSKNHEVAFITFNSIQDDCQCPEGKTILDETNYKYTFAMPKVHCFHMNCSVDVQLAEAARHNYRLEIAPRYYNGVTNMFSMKDGGTSDYFNFERYYGAQNFISVHSHVIIYRSEGTEPTHDCVYVYLVPITPAQQALCDCPLFLPTLTIAMDPSCPSVDCLWSLPKIQYDFIPTISVESNSTNEYEYLYLSTTHEDMKRWEILSNGFEDPLYFGKEENMQQTHVNLHYHRRLSDREENESSTYSFYKITLSTHYNLTEHEHACGCFNRTMKVDPSTELTFSSPRYPLHYCSNLNCRTVFEAPKGYRVVFRPHVLSLQKGADYLNLYDVIDGKEIGREIYTGTYLDGFTTESRTSQFLAVFTSDHSINYDGFNATVYAAPMDNDSDFDDAEPVNKSGFFVKFLLILLFLGSVVVAVLYRRSQRSGLRLSFAPVTFMSGRGEFDDGSVNFNFSN